MKRTPMIVLALCLAAGLAASPTFAQGAITDGDVTFEYTLFDVAGGNFADLEVDTGTDHMFQQWWYYRLAVDGAETIFPPPDTESYVGNVATLTWADVDGRGFSATAVTTVSDTGDTAGGVRHDLTITNDGPLPLLITLFNYTDLDVDASAGSDSADDLTATHIGVMETSLSSYRGLGADAFKVTPFFDLRAELEDGGITDLDNSGTPFGPGDFTGGFQWDTMMILSGVSGTFSTVHNVNDATAPLELAFSGTCPGPVEVRIAGATPGGRVTVAGADLLGSFTIPVGGCAGTELNLGSPSVLGSVNADANGRRTLNVNLPSSLCGQVAQAVDLSSCGTTNTDRIPTP